MGTVAAIRTGLRAITTMINPSRCTNFAAPPATPIIHTGLLMTSLHMIAGLLTTNLHMTAELVMIAMLLAYPHPVALRLTRTVIVLHQALSTSVMTHLQLLTTRLQTDPDLHRASAIIIRTTMSATVVALTIPRTIAARHAAAIVVVLAQDWLPNENFSKPIALPLLN